MLGRAMLVYYPFKFPAWPLSTPVNLLLRKERAWDFCGNPITGNNHH